jgi:hypothetical protein
VLTSVITALLAKDPAARPSDDEARTLLERAARGDATTMLTATTAVPPARVDRDRRRRGSGGALVAGLAALLLLGALGVIVLRNAPRDGATAATTTTSAAGQVSVGAAGGVETTMTTAATTSTTAASTTTIGATPEGVPAGWIPYEGDGWSISHPATWRPRDAGGGQVDFIAPNGDYLRVGSVTPASNGGDPVAAWEEQEKGFRQRHPDYQRITIEPTDYRSYDAAIWEYTFEGEHADNLGFVIGDTGYALNFVTAASRWDDSADIHDAYRAAFKPRA